MKYNLSSQLHVTHKTDTAIGACELELGSICKLLIYVIYQNVMLQQQFERERIVISATGTGTIEYLYAKESTLTHTSYHLQKLT